MGHGKLLALIGALEFVNISVPRVRQINSVVRSRVFRVTCFMCYTVVAVEAGVDSGDIVCGTWIVCISTRSPDFLFRLVLAGECAEGETELEVGVKHTAFSVIDRHGMRNVDFGVVEPAACNAVCDSLFTELLISFGSRRICS